MSNTDLIAWLNATADDWEPAIAGFVSPMQTKLRQTVIALTEKTARIAELEAMHQDAARWEAIAASYQSEKEAAEAEVARLEEALKGFASRAHAVLAALDQAESET